MRMIKIDENKNLMYSFLIFSMFLFFSKNMNAQLVNIESRRMQTDSTRFVLNSDLLFSYTDNDDEYILQTNANLSAQLKSKDYKKIYFLISNYSIIRSNDEEFQNSWFVHLRFNRKLSEKFVLENFIQSQNDQNLTIVQRNLAGVGLRYKLMTSKNTRIYLGNSYMYEMEIVEDSNEILYNHRNNSYISANQFFTGLNLKFTGTLYFQPLYKSIKNNKTLAQLKAEVPLHKNISFSALLNYFVIQFGSDLENDKSTNVNFGFTFKI